MSIKTTSGIDVSVDSVELEINPSTELSVNTEHTICSEEPQEVTATRKEYSIVGDAFYAGMNSQITPPWLEDLIDDSVNLAVDAGLVDYDLLIQDVRSAIDSIDVAKNTFVHEIGFDERVDSIVAYNLTTFNVQLDNKFATIVDLDVVEANAEYALASRTSDLEVEFNDTINSRITTVENAYASADEALANSINALTTVYQNQEEDLSGVADAVSGLQTYVGLTEDSYPNGTGMLARVSLLEKQNDGIIEYLTGTYDVMVGVVEDDDNTANDELVTDALPYALWIPMEGTGVPTATTRPYMDYAADVPVQKQAPLLENTVYVRSDYTDSDVDRYYIYSENVWRSISAAAYQIERTALRLAHTADVYVQYSNNNSGVKSYLKSYKFIQTSTDVTSPYSTDPDGFSWAIVTDTDSQAAYMVALNAQDLADSKRRVFVAQPFPPYDAGDLWIDDTGTVQIVRASKTNVPAEGVFNDSHWVLADEYAKNFVDTIYTPDSAQLHRQLDGKTEVYFYETYNDSTGEVDLSNANNEQEALDLIDNVWNTEELKDAANGDIVYFKDSENAYWYQASTPAWLVVTDTTVYQAVKAASDAQGAADGKVSQFFAWGGDAAPETYEVLISPAEYSMNAYGEYLDINGDVTTVPSEYVLLVPEQKATIESDDYVYWFLNGTLYRKGTSGWSNKVPVPTEAGDGSFIAEGDVLTVFDPVTGDLSVYSFNGTSWQITGPSGIISKSRFFIDLENSVNGPLGLARAVADLEITSSAYTDDKTALVENKFEYSSKLFIGGYYYESGFGLESSGITQQTDGLTPETAFDSEFWVNAERFVLKSPSYPGIQAEFKVTASGITLGLEHTEATRNKPVGTHSSAVPYLEGDMVESNGSSYVARRDVPAGISIGNATYWQLLSSIGYSGKGSDYWFKRSDSLPVDKPYATGADSNGWYTDLSNPNLNGSGDLYTIKGTKAEGSDVWVYDAPVINNKKFVRELTIYAGPTTGTVGIPNSSTYDFSTDTLNIGSNPSGWGTSVPSIYDKDQKVFVTTALVSGNETETSVAVNWNAAAVYAHRVDGVSPDALTVDTSVSNGVTTLTFSDGTTATINDGASSGVTIIYADDEAGTNASFTQGSRQFVNYYEWTGSAPVTVPSGLTYTPFVGKDGDSAGVLPIYADSPTGLNATFTFNDQEYVNFYEWSGDAPTTVPAGLTYVKFIGKDGLSAYEVWLLEGGEGTEADFIEYLNATDGVDGNTWYSGSANPSGSLGKVGDFYLKSGRYVYEKTGTSTWTYLEDLMGPEGPPSTVPGPSGSRGSSILTYEMTPSTATPESISSSTLAGYWDESANNNQKDEIEGDTLVVTNPHATAGWTHIFEFNGSIWTTTVVFTVNGNQVVEGTISADKLEADIILGRDATFTGTVVIGGKNYDSDTSIPPEDVGADPAGSADAALTAANTWTENRIYPNQDNLHISSSSYSPGVSGWAIDAAGNSEFNNTVVRGTVYATAGVIGGITLVDGNLIADTLNIAGNAITAAIYVSIPTFSIAKNSYVTKSTPITDITNNDETAYMIATISTRARRTSSGSGSDNVKVTVTARTADDVFIASDNYTLDSAESAGTDFGNTIILYGKTTDSMYIDVTVATGGESWQVEVTGGSIQSARR